jgi:hypothetical protein
MTKKERDAVTEMRSRISRLAFGAKEDVDARPESPTAKAYRRGVLESLEIMEEVYFRSLRSVDMSTGFPMIRVSK